MVRRNEVGTPRSTRKRDFEIPIDSGHPDLRLEEARTVLPAPFRPTIRVRGLGKMIAFSFWGEKDRMPLIRSFSTLHMLRVRATTRFQNSENKAQIYLLAPFKIISCLPSPHAAGRRDDRVGLTGIRGRCQWEVSVWTTTATRASKCGRSAT